MNFWMDYCRVEQLATAEAHNISKNFPDTVVIKTVRTNTMCKVTAAAIMEEALRGQMEAIKGTVEWKIWEKTVEVGVKAELQGIAIPILIKTFQTVMEEVVWTWEAMVDRVATVLAVLALASFAVMVTRVRLHWLKDQVFNQI